MGTGLLIPLTQTQKGHLIVVCPGQNIFVKEQKYRGNKRIATSTKRNSTHCVDFGIIPVLTNHTLRGIIRNMGIIPPIPLLTRGGTTIKAAARSRSHKVNISHRFQNFNISPATKLQKVFFSPRIPPLFAKSSAEQEKPAGGVDVETMESRERLPTVPTSLQALNLWKAGIQARTHTLSKAKRRPSNTDPISAGFPQIQHHCGGRQTPFAISPLMLKFRNLWKMLTLWKRQQQPNRHDDRPSRKSKKKGVKK